MAMNVLGKGMAWEVGGGQKRWVAIWAVGCRFWVESDGQNENENENEDEDESEDGSEGENEKSIVHG